MIINLPIEVQNRLDDIDEPRLVLIGLLQRFKELYKSKCYSMYQTDVYVIINSNRQFVPHDIIKNLEDVVKLKWVGDYKFDIILTDWSGEVFEYEISHIRNKFMWAYLYDSWGYIETKDNMPTVSMVEKNQYRLPALVQAFKHTHPPYAK